MFALTAPKAEEVLDLSLADPFDGAPELFLTELRARSLEVRAHKYPSKTGEIELKEAIALDYLRKYGVELDPKTEIVITNGAWAGLRDALSALGWLGCPVAYAEPAFSGFDLIIRALGMRPCPVPLQAILGEPDRVEETFAKIAGALFLLNFPHNPSGMTASPEQLHLIAQIARAYGVRIVSDFVYGELFQGSRPDSFLMHDAAAALEVGSFSKTFRLAGWRIGWIAGKEDGIRTVSKLRQSIENGTPPALQLAAAALVRN